MKFCGSDKHIEGLKFAGVDVANLGNNHSANYGKAGIDETKQLLEKNGIAVTGLNGPVYLQVKGIKFAFLGYSDIEKTPLVSTAEEGRIKAEVGEARKNADVVIVQYHWGTEYMTPPEDRQKFLGRLTIDSGADLVIGNHPHWIKPIEFYNGKLITYGHGNFIFDQEWSQKTKEGVVGKYTFYGKDLIDAQYLPVELVSYGQPYFLEGARKKAILDEMHKESVVLK
jgi:poly-gamma-glutamate synthesis protein (capsule biosynthesis protein)